jgi:hypothetical protein
MEQHNDFNMKNRFNKEKNKSSPHNKTSLQLESLNNVGDFTYSTYSAQAAY